MVGKHNNSRQDFQNYISEVFGPVVETASYYERIGPPDELPAVIGLICMNFSDLEDILSKTIIEMLQIEHERGQIMTAELSFRVKVNVFSSLYNLLKTKYSFNTYPGFEDEYFKELIAALNKSEELRNQIIHSSFAKNYLDQEKIFRNKTTAKQKGGLKKITEETNIVGLFNISDFISQVLFELHQFQIEIMTPKSI